MLYLQDLMECREGGIVEEYQLDNTVNNPNRVPELFSLELLTLVKAEPRLTLFQNTYLTSVVMDNSTALGTCRTSIGAKAPLVWLCCAIECHEQHVVRTRVCTYVLSVVCERACRAQLLNFWSKVGC